MVNVVEVFKVFPYLGSQITHVLSDRDKHFELARGAMSALGQRVWRSKHLSRRTKVDLDNNRSIEIKTGLFRDKILTMDPWVLMV